MKNATYILLVLMAIIGPSILVCLCGCNSPMLTTKRPMLYAFTSASCAPCYRDKPALEAIARSGRVGVEVIDADRRPDLAEAYGVTNLPDYLVYVNGQLYFRTHDINDVVRVGR